MKKLVILFSFMLSAGIVLAQGYQVGSEAQDFKLKNTEGKWVSLADYNKAKGFVVIFTCNHCPYAIAYEDRIIALHAKYEALGYPVVAINPNDPEVQPEDSYELMKVKAKEKGFKFNYLFDEGQKIYPAFGATRTPHVFVLQNENKKLVVKYIGTIDDSSRDASAVTKTYLADALDALIAGKKVELDNTKAVGCSIKVKKSE